MYLKGGYMFGFIKKIFGSEDKVEGPGISTPKVEPTISQPTKYSDVKKTSKKPVQEKQEEPKKRGRKKTGVTKTDLNKMTKDELEAYAKKEYKVDLDKRRKKADLVEEVLKLAK